jgi:hypothetical protein
LTVKGRLESFGDQRHFTDEQLIDALTRVFAAAAAPQNKV